MNILRTVPVVACCLAWSSAAIAEVDIDLDGRPTRISSDLYNYSAEALSVPFFQCGTGVRELEKALEFYEVSLPESPDFDQSLRFAGFATLVGKSTEARSLLFRAERLKPGTPDVAMMLANSYESSGNSNSALEWTLKAMERKARGASYLWIQARVLEAKLASDSDLNWLQAHSATGVDFGSEPRPVADPRLPREIFPDAISLLHAIGSETRERTLFSRAPNQFIGALLFDLGNALAVSGAVRKAVGVYELAEKYGAPNSKLLQARLAFARNVVEEGMKRMEGRGGLR